jgi:hypothetical protein
MRQWISVPTLLLTAYFVCWYYYPWHTLTVTLTVGLSLCVLYVRYAEGVNRRRFNLPPFGKKRSFLTVVLLSSIVPALWVAILLAKQCGVHALSDVAVPKWVTVTSWQIGPPLGWFLGGVYFLNRHGDMRKYFRLRLDETFVEEPSWWRWRPMNVIMLTHECRHDFAIKFTREGRTFKSTLTFVGTFQRKTKEAAAYYARNFATVSRTLASDEKVTVSVLRTRLVHMPSNQAGYREDSSPDATFSIEMTLLLSGPSQTT